MKLQLEIGKIITCEGFSLERNCPLTKRRSIEIRDFHWTWLCGNMHPKLGHWQHTSISCRRQKKNAEECIIVIHLFWLNMLYPTMVLFADSNNMLFSMITGHCLGIKKIEYAYISKVYKTYKTLFSFYFHFIWFRSSLSWRAANQLHLNMILPRWLRFCATRLNAALIRMAHTCWPARSEVWCTHSMQYFTGVYTYM